MKFIPKIWLLIVFVIIVILTTIYRHYSLNKALKNSTLVVGTVKRFNTLHSGTEVVVNVLYNDQIIHINYVTYTLDSLKLNSKVKFLVSKTNPTNYYKYIGVLP